MNKALIVLTSVVLLGVGAMAIFNGPATAQVIANGTNAVRGLFQDVRTGSGIGWLVAYGATWLILIFVADAGADELATALAGAMFIAVLYAQIANGQLQANLKELGVGA